MGRRLLYAFFVTAAGNTHVLDYLKRIITSQLIFLLDFQYCKTRKGSSVSLEDGRRRRVRVLAVM